MGPTISGTFAYTEDSTIRELKMDEDLIAEVNVIGGEIIKRGLYKYGYLNGALIQWYLNVTGHKRIKGDKSAAKLCSVGDVKKYVIERGNGSVISVYTLTDDQVEQIERKRKSTNSYNRNLDDKDIPYVLEQLSLAQFHILAQSNPKISEQYYNHPVLLRDGRAVVIPSLLRYKSGFYQTLHFIAIPVPKGREVKNTASFMARLLLIKEYFAERSEYYRSLTYIIICDSDEQIRDMAYLIDKMADLKDIFVMYARDSLWGITDGSNKGIPYDPLKKLYKCEVISGKVDMSLVRLN